MHINVSRTLKGLRNELLCIFNLCHISFGQRVPPSAINTTRNIDQHHLSCVASYIFMRSIVARKKQLILTGRRKSINVASFHHTALLCQPAGGIGGAGRIHKAINN